MSGHPLTAAAFVRDSAQQWGDAPLLVTPGGSLTYAELERDSAALAGRLVQAGVGKGTPVGILCPNGVEWLVSWAATTRIGAVAVLLSTYATPIELGRMLRHADVALLLVAPGAGRHDYLARIEEAAPTLDRSTGEHLFVAELPALRAVWLWSGKSAERPWATHIEEAELAAVDAGLREAVEDVVDPSDPSTVIYTSGSTAEPKGIIHSHAALLRHTRRGMLRSRPVGPGDRIYSPNPFFWIGGLGVTILGTMHGGATLLAEATFDPETTLDFLEKEKATLFLGQPHALRMLEEHPSFASRNLAGIRPTKIGRALAMTETCSAHAATDAGEGRPDDPGCFGRPIDGIEHRIVDSASGAVVDEWQEGEICVRGEDMMLGMVRRSREEVFDADGWYHTGDRGSVGNGEIYFLGRLDDRIRYRGMNIYPRELEAELQLIDGVAQAIVVGVESPDHGQDVAAAIVTGPGDTLTAEQLRQRIRARLSPYKVPTYLLVITTDELPLTGTGKLDRSGISSRLAHLAQVNPSSGSSSRHC